MNYNFAPAKAKITEITLHLENELKSIRTGRASAALVEGISVSTYSSTLPLRQIANLSVEDAKTVRITPWDASSIKEIEKAIMVANLGVGTSVDEKGVRVVFPDLTSERREILAKSARQKLEEAKIALRHERDRLWSDIQGKEKQGGMSEDEKFRFKDEMEKLIADAQKKFEGMTLKKEQEIKS
ncbi:MAG: ribosome-recycling factor [Patescibacteria group bacterium]